MLVVLYGCLLILRNGREENFGLSDVIHVALNDEMYAASRSLTDHTKVYFVGNDASGKLLPTLPGGDGFGRSDSSSMGSGDLKPLPSIPRRSRFLTAVHAKMLLFLLATLICMIVHNAYYRYLDGKAPSFSLRTSDSSSWSRNQTVVSDIGTAISYVVQVFLASVISASCVQLYWLAIRSRGHRIAQIDALMSVHTSPFSLLLLRALSASIPVCIVAMLASSASVVSIFAPSAIKLNTNHLQTNDCTVSTPRNLSSIVTPATDNSYLSPMGAVLASGSYLPPVIQCDLGSSSQCSYDLQFVGPGLSCEDVTAISNYTTFANGRQLDITGKINLFQAITIPQDSNLFMQIAVGSWDVKRQLYQASNCTGVSRSYSVTLSKSTTTPYNINVTGNDVLSKIQANETSPPDFESFYMYSILNLMRQMRITIDGGYAPEAVLQVPINMNPTESVAGMPFGDNSGGGLGFYQLDSNITWADNMTQALEVFAQNMTMSLLSQQILNYNSNDPDVLQNVTTTCSTFSPAYEYTPYRLYLTYGVAIGIAAICACWGAIAIAQNGVAENLDFSRILRSILNERLFIAKDGLTNDTRVRADDTVEGKIVPSLL
ncbi:hypothetical protein SCHPADRAFT_567190 [Schizopora paradoxa]|uniref:Uncharacterized protein n=1 Tax=Schizopora paradoxa TaxID=27342 RepID=A0A0H2RIX6_9AGAM|nr:hypothetical protein SCHPADRAFT_567190 [Schizopora paradoxa]